VTIGVDYPAREAVKLLQDTDLLQMVTSMYVQENSAGPITDVIQRDIRDREFPDMCEAPRVGRSLDHFAGKGAA